MSILQYTAPELRQRNTKVHEQYKRVGGCSNAHSSKITQHSDIKPKTFVKLFPQHVDSCIWDILVEGRKCAKYNTDTSHLAILLENLGENERCSSETFEKVLKELALIANKYNPKNEKLFQLLQGQTKGSEQIHWIYKVPAYIRALAAGLMFSCRGAVKRSFFDQKPFDFQAFLMEKDTQNCAHFFETINSFGSDVVNPVLPSMVTSGETLRQALKQRYVQQLAPFGFLSAQVVVDTCTSKNPNGIKARFAESVKKNLSFQQVAYLATVTA